MDIAISDSDPAIYAQRKKTFLAIGAICATGK